jgi:eukaryotic-like serine/threonine-protein kinase
MGEGPSDSSRDRSAVVGPGDVIAEKYCIEGPIGEGGMATVFVAQHLLLDNKVAVKVLLPELTSNPELVARFINEARAAARIDNNHVSRVLDVGRLPGGAPYMVMELLEGTDLQDLLHARGTIPVEEAAGYVLQALEAIAQAHAMGIVHRDLKPSNLYLARRKDGTSRVKVLDFGISKAKNPLNEAHNALTSTKSMLGTPVYMSPEQVRNASRVDARSDVWALGVILHELVAGKPPFAGETLGELLVAIREERPAPLRTIRPEVPEAFEALVLKCLARAPEDRFEHVADLATALAPLAPVGLASSPAERVRASLASATNEGRISIASSREPVVAHAATVPFGATPAPPESLTQGSWHATRPGRPARKRAIAPVLIGGVAVVVGAIVVAVVALSLHHTPATAAAVAEPSAPSPVASDSSSATAQLAPPPPEDQTPEPSASVPPSPPPGAPAAPARPHHAAPGTGPAPTSKPASTAKPAPGYDPLKDPRSG